MIVALLSDRRADVIFLPKSAKTIFAVFGRLNLLYKTNKHETRSSAPHEVNLSSYPPPHPPHPFPSHMAEHHSQIQVCFTLKTSQERIICTGSAAGPGEGAETGRWATTGRLQSMEEARHHRNRVRQLQPTHAPVLKQRQRERCSVLIL